MSLAQRICKHILQCGRVHIDVALRTVDGAMAQQDSNRAMSPVEASTLPAKPRRPLWLEPLIPARLNRVVT